MPLPIEKSRPATSIKDYITMFYGPPGVGKSTFVNSFGKVLFLSTDRGTRFMEAMRVECLQWKDFERVAKELEASGAPRYDFLCIDHVDDMASMAEEAVCQELRIDALGDAGFGKGWKAYRNHLEGFVRRMMRLHTGVVFIAHEEIKTVKSRSVELQRIMPAMGKSAWKVIVPLADIIGYCGYKTLKGPPLKEVRIVDTCPREDLYAKDRTIRRKPTGGAIEVLDGHRFIETFTLNGESSNGTSKTETRVTPTTPSRRSREAIQSAVSRIQQIGGRARR